MIDVPIAEAHNRLSALLKKVQSDSGVSAAELYRAARDELEGGR